MLAKHKMRYANKNVAVIGGGHSAINTILELEKIKQEFPQTQINWILRKEKISDVYGGQEDDALEARGALGVKIEALVNEEKIHARVPEFSETIVKELKKPKNIFLMPLLA